MAAEQENARRRTGPREPRRNPIGRARLAVAGTAKAGARTYDRERDLPALIRLDPFAVAAEDAEGIARIMATLERALRAERCRARSGHWTYDLNRHIALHQAFLAESERLAALRAAVPGKPAPK